MASLRKEGEGLRQRVEEERGKANETKEKVSGSEWVWFLARVISHTMQVEEFLTGLPNLGHYRKRYVVISFLCK